MTMCNPGTALGQLHQDLQRIKRKNDNEMDKINRRLASLECTMREIRSLASGLCRVQKTSADRRTED